MPRSEICGIDRSLSIEELNLRIEKARYDRDRGIEPVKQNKRIKRLGFVLLRYQDFSIEEAARMIGITAQTGYNWQRRWNSEKLGSITPNFNGGKHSLLDDSQKRTFHEGVVSGRMTTAEARDFAERSFGICYSEKQVHVILMGMGLRHISFPPDMQSEDRRRRMRWVE